MSRQFNILAFFGVSACVLGVLLASCAQPPKRSPAPQIHRPDYDMVAAIRAAGHKDDSAVQVKPMRDAHTDALLRKVRADEVAGRYQQAASVLDGALKDTPDAPELLQDRAEMAVRLQQWDEAAQLAMRSWKLGPKVGGLCARNWQTVVEMRKLHGDSAGAASARKQLAKCQVAGVKRM